ncbi:MAG: hypothetical protein WCS84_14520, partial [Nocardioides sp.]
MSNFCGYCGTASEGGKFCTSCGRPFGEPGHPGPHEDVDATQARGPLPSQPPPAWTPPPPMPPPMPTQMPAQMPMPTPMPTPTASYPQQGYPPPRPATPTVNPFLGVPLGDYVRDALA